MVALIFVRKYQISKLGVLIVMSSRTTPAKKNRVRRFPQFEEFCTIVPFPSLVNENTKKALFVLASFPNWRDLYSAIYEGSIPNDTIKGIEKYKIQAQDNVSLLQKRWKCVLDLIDASKLKNDTREIKKVLASFPEMNHFVEDLLKTEKQEEKIRRSWGVSEFLKAFITVQHPLYQHLWGVFDGTPLYDTMNTLCQYKSKQDQIPVNELSNAIYYVFCG